MRIPLISASFAVGLLALTSPALAQKNLKIQSVAYDQHFNPTGTLSFTVIVQNNETINEFAEVDVTLTKIVGGGGETTLTPVLIGTVPARGSLRLARAGDGGFTYSLTTSGIGTGIYTVSFPLFDGNGTKIDQVGGPFPIHVGTETDSIHVFPEAVHLGNIPPGRTMFPTPMEVSWSFFRFNRLSLDQPFAIRIYTDNAARYQGIPGAIRRISPAGLVSLDGRYAIPLKIWSLNFGPDIQETGWDAQLAGPPPVDDDDFWNGPQPLEGVRLESARNPSWARIPDLVDMTSDPSSWRRLIGQDPDDARFVSDSNLTGDFTLKNPFTFYIATEAGPTAVEGSYAATLIVELWSP